MVYKLLNPPVIDISSNYDRVYYKRYETCKYDIDDTYFTSFVPGDLLQEAIMDCSFLLKLKAIHIFSSMFLLIEDKDSISLWSPFKEI